ncbi:Histone deacetylase complex subunit sap18 [Perkinsus olseni]|uniref:Histone deacetylase complex subunit sap18 n=1 Tax=Perkinsus olseni TaxID=32597 RepID=A0A7J6S0W4_PEROL|nr:Histone deacetylase complex subunit sap18 [Perkinsus olseni]
MPAQVLSNAVDRSISWLGGYLPVEAAREKFPLVNTGINLADTYGRPLVVKVDSKLDGAVDRGSKLLESIRSNSDAIVAMVGRIRESLSANKQAVQSKITGLAEDGKYQLTHLQELTVQTATDTYKVASARIQSIPRSLNVDVHLVFDTNNRIIGGIIGAKDQLITITTRGLDMTVGEDRRKIVIERGTEAFDVMMGYARKLVPAVAAAPAEVPSSEAQICSEENMLTAAGADETVRRVGDASDDDVLPECGLENQEDRPDPLEGPRVRSSSVVFKGHLTGELARQEQERAVLQEDLNRLAWQLNQAGLVGAIDESEEAPRESPSLPGQAPSEDTSLPMSYTDLAWNAFFLPVTAPLWVGRSAVTATRAAASMTKNKVQSTVHRMVGPVLARISPIYPLITPLIAALNQLTPRRAQHAGRVVSTVVAYGSKAVTNEEYGKAQKATRVLIREGVGAASTPEARQILVLLGELWMRIMDVIASPQCRAAGQSAHRLVVGSLAALHSTNTDRFVAAVSRYLSAGVDFLASEDVAAFVGATLRDLEMWLESEHEVWQKEKRSRAERSRAADSAEDSSSQDVLDQDLDSPLDVSGDGELECDVAVAAGELARQQPENRELRRRRQRVLRGSVRRMPPPADRHSVRRHSTIDLVGKGQAFLGRVEKTVNVGVLLVVIWSILGMYGLIKLVGLT